LKWRCSGEFSACLVQLSLTAFDVDPQTVAMTNQLGMLGWDIAGSGFIFKPKSTRGTGNVDGGSTKVVQTESSPQTGRKPGLEGAGPNALDPSAGVLSQTAVQSGKSGGYGAELTGVSSKQLEKKFKHASAFGVVTTKKNPETIAQFEEAIRVHMSSPTTTQHGTYGFVAGSKVFFDSKTSNAVVLDSSGKFVTGFKLVRGTTQFDNFVKNGVLR